MSDWPVIVVGAGPAGLACARALSRRGVRCLLLERRGFPVDKVCGEGLMPVGLRSLQELGVTLNCGQPFQGLCYRLGGLSLRADFAEGPGRGVRRLQLAEALRPPDVPLECGVQVQALHRRSTRMELETNRGLFRCRLVLGADGLHSSVRRYLGWDAGPGWLRRWGWRQHFATRPWSSDVEVHYGKRCEAYVTPVGENLVGVAVLSGKGLRRSNWLSGFPELRERLQNALPASELAGYGPLWQSSRRVHAPGALLVGDAAGYLDACTGEGLSLAFAQAVALAEQWPGSSAGLVHLPAYPERYRELTRHYKLLTGAVLALNQWPAVHRLVLRGLQLRPRLLQVLLSANQGLAGPPQLLAALRRP